jgi:hypothetical protein
MLVIYVPDFEPVEGAAFSPIAALLAAVALAGFVAVAFEASPRRR